MKVQLNRKPFDDALGVVASAASARASLPILSHLYIEAQSDTVRLVGSDLEQWVECRIPAMVGEDGATTLPARLLTDLVGSLGGEDIHIESGERYQAILTSGDSLLRRLCTLTRLLRLRPRNRLALLAKQHQVALRVI